MKIHYFVNYVKCPNIGYWWCWGAGREGINKCPGSYSLAISSDETLKATTPLLLFPKVKSLALDNKHVALV